jgi:dTDP-glucose pyrophosphorylase
MGSRYGGLKQIDPVGPAGETIIDYSIYDALRAGFGKLVFVIRRDFEQAFKEIAGTGSAANAASLHAPLTGGFGQSLILVQEFVYAEWFAQDRHAK